MIQSMIKRAWRGAAFVAVLPIAVAAGPAAAVDGVVATPALIDVLDPHLAQGAAGGAFTANVFDTLVNPNQTPSDGRGRTVPGIATSWKIVDDGKAIDFTIRDNAMFHNGQKVTADDVVFSIERIVNPATKQPYRTSYFATLKGAEKLSPTLVRLHYTVPWPGVFDALAARGHIIPKEYFEKVGAEEYAKKPIGSGPYAMTNYRRGDQMELVAQKNYWGGDSYLTKINWRSVPDVNTRVAMLCSGEADAVTDIQPPLIKAIKSCGANVAVLKGIHQRFLIMNTLKDGPFTDRRVRMAMNIAIDRKDVFDAIFGSEVEWVNGELSPYHVAGRSVERYPYDPERAKKLLAEAGYPNGFSTEIIYTAGRYFDDAELLPTLVSYWKKIGVNVTTRTVEYNQWLKFAGQKAYTGMLSYSKGAGTIADPTSAFDRHAMCGALYSAYCNKELDDVVKMASGIIDEKKLEEIFAKAQRISHDEAPKVFLYDLPTIFGWKKGLKWTSEYGGMEQGASWAALVKG